MSFWNSTRRFAALWGFAAFVALVVVAFHRVLLPFLLALLLSYVLAPVIDHLSGLPVGGRPLPRFMAVIVVYVGILASLGLFLGLVLPRLSGDFARLIKEAPGFFQKVESDYAPRVERWIEENFPSDASPEGERAGPQRERRIEMRRSGVDEWEVSLEGAELEIEKAGKDRWVIGPRHDVVADRPLRAWMAQIARSGQTEALDVIRYGQRFLAAVVRAIATFVLVLMVTAFLLVDSVRVKAFARGLVPEAFRGEYDGVLAEVDRGLSGVIRGQFLICLVNAVLTYIGLVILQVKYSLILGLLAGAMSLIPVFGSILSSVPIVAIALVGGEHADLARGLGVLGWIIGIHLLEANFLNPKIIGDAAKIHPVVVIFSLVVGEHHGGLVGALFAVPVASIVQTLFLFFLRRRAATGGEPAVETPGQASG